VNDELERIWKEEVVAQFKVSNIFLDGLRQTTKKLRRGSRSPGRDHPVSV
jgi:hypothetical protein